MSRPPLINILLVEDNPADADLMMSALESVRTKNKIRVVTDGEEAMAYLRREGTHAEAIRPDLILLDLNIPKMDGREVLAAMKDDPKLCGIPVVVLTSSAADRDISDSYRLRANCFVTKPADLDGFYAAVQAIERFWLEIARLPV